MALFEAARALAAADNRLEVTLADLRMVAPMALRQRQTDFVTKYFAAQREEDERIASIIGSAKRSGRKSQVAKSNTARNGHRADETVSAPQEKAEKTTSRAK
jgi:magnesium chelatase subunit I